MKRAELSLYAACVCFGLALTHCEASADTMGLHVGTIHLPNDGYCNANPGLYYRTDGGWQVGVYRNSICRASFYAGKAWETDGEGLRFGAFLGAATGYHVPIMPMALASVSMPFTGQMRARISFAPILHEKAGAILHLSFEKEF